MASAWDIVVRLGMVAVALVLLAGLWNMLRGGSPSRSQNLMRWRVGLQFIVIVVVMGGLYFFGRQ
ncbi:twin transmembrane helix small protein [Roseibium aestuarii]|uniref:Twin transmembrane helix small protein n=1 Tax=Roseibium aestuarii TaxID=2600299 RepID=A0ABW4K0B6_9HYPH|nr:twin transmembrane helix small protein [Roseibium aestuarii]